MRRVLVVLALLVGCCLTSPAVAAMAVGKAGPGQYAREDGRAGWTTHEVKLAVRGVARYFDPSGGVAKSVDVARCESRFNPRDTLGKYHGVFALSHEEFADSWAKWRQVWRRWGLVRSVWNPRSNIAVALHRARTYGWGGWSCS